MATDAASAAAVAGLVDDILQDEIAASVTDLSGVSPPVQVDPGDLTGMYHRVETGDPGVAAYQPGVVAPPVGEQAAPAPEPPALPSWDADTTGIEDLFDEDDDEPDGIGDEPIFETPVQAENEWEDDDEKRALKSRLAKAERQIEWERKQRAKVAEKEWRAEAGRRFPLSDPDTINATSRRGFLRQAAEQHQRVEKKIKPVTDALEALRTETVQEAKQEARVEAAQQWGVPTAGPSAAHAVVQSQQKEIRREDYRSFHEYAAAKLKAGMYGPI